MAEEIQDIPDEKLDQFFALDIKTKPEEFRKFHELLTKENPDYQPFYFQLAKNGKEPVAGVSWKKKRLTFPEAYGLMKRGYNIGLAATSKDILCIVDVDNLDAVEYIKPTLVIQSRKRIGRHNFFFTYDECPYDNEKNELKADALYVNTAKFNIPTDNDGEVRAIWQYVVVAGSYVPCSEEEINRIPEEDRINAGKYTIFAENEVSTITYSELPGIFLRVQEERRAEDTGKILRTVDKVQREKNENPDQKNQSALWKLDIHDVTGKMNDPAKRFPMFPEIHGSENGSNASVSKDLLHCWRHEVAHNAFSYLAVVSGVSSCMIAGCPHGGSGYGVDSQDPETVFKVWKYAKDNGYIPKDDPMPSKAWVYVALDRKLCEKQDIIDGWKLPAHVYNKVLVECEKQGIVTERTKFEEKLFANASGSDEFNYDTCLTALAKVKPKQNGFERLRQAKEFILSEILSKNGDVVDMEIFIEGIIFEYFNLPSGKNSDARKIIGKVYKDILKDKLHKQKSERQFIKSDTYDISPEFDGLYLLNTDGKKTILPFIDKIAKRVIENKHVIMFNDNMFAYQDGYYKNDPISVRAEATRILNGILKDEKSGGISSKLNDVMTYIKNDNPVNEYPFNTSTNAFPVKNGVVVLDFETGTCMLEDHDPEKWKFNYIMPVECDKNASGDLIVDEFKKYTTEYNVLIQVLAQALLQAMRYGPYKMAYLFKGPKDCGKTTILELYEMLIGVSCKCSIGLNELTPQFRFSKAGLEGKLLNLHDDLGYFRMSETGVFKSLTGGYSHQVEHKGIMPYNANLTAVHVFTTNTPAGFDRVIYNDLAFWERWCYVEFNNRFVIDDDFKKRVFTEENISGLLNEIIKMMFEIKKNKRLPFTQDWTEVRDKWVQESNLLYKFIEDNMVAGGTTAIMKEQLLTALGQWCRDTKQKEEMIPRSTPELSDLVEVCGGEMDARRKFMGREDEGVKHCYILNFTWKPTSRYKIYTTACVTDIPIAIQPTVNSFTEGLAECV
jgi:phage/plasmid-associated DNA primase